MGEIENQVQEYCNAGCEPQGIKVLFDRNLYRFKTHRKDDEESGWIWSVDNGNHKAAVIGSWDSRLEKKTFFEGENGKPPSPKQLKSIERQYRESRVEFDAQKEADHQVVAKECELIWEKALKKPKQFFKNDYFERKGIKSYEKYVRFGHKGEIYIPMRDIDGKLWSIQTIYPDGNKRFKKGGRTKGLFFEIPPESNKFSSKIYFCEGLATGASVHKVVFGKIVICFSAHNLPVVVQKYRRHNKHLDFVICADNDAWSEKKNAGLEFGKKARSKCSGHLIYPEFGHGLKEQKPTDFNDLEHCCGQEAVIDAFKNVPNDFGDKIHCLGYGQGEIYLTSKTYHEILKTKALTKNHLTLLLDTDSNILTEYEYVDTKGNTKIHYQGLIDDLIVACKKAGRFNPNDIRGPGVWEDAGRIVVHLGNKLSVDGKEFGLSEIVSEHIYIAGSVRPPLLEPLEARDGVFLRNEIFHEFKWEDARVHAGDLLLGWLFTSHLCGVLPIRPHVWLTGGAETGKSSLKDQCIFPLIGGKKNMIYLEGATTEAGLRQKVNNSSKPVVFDEFETDNEKTGGEVEQCVRLMRSVWDGDGATIVKGTPEGNALEYNLIFGAIVFSIRVRLLGEADKGRFSVLELVKGDGDTEHWGRLLSNMKKIDEDFSNRFFARSVKMLPVVLKNFEILKTEITKECKSARVGDQYGMLLAGFFAATQDEVVNLEDAKMYAMCLREDINDQGPERRGDDSMDCLSQMLSTSLVVENENGDRHPMSIIDIIKKVKDLKENSVPGNFRIKEFLESVLSSIGLKVSMLRTNKSWILAVAGNNAALNRTVYARTKWDQTYLSAINRIKGVESNKPLRVGSTVMKCSQVPFEILDALDNLETDQGD